jgi:hypothetical protein
LACQMTAAAQPAAAIDTPTRPRFNLLWNAAVMLSPIHVADGAETAQQPAMILGWRRSRAPWREKLGQLARFTSTLSFGFSGAEIPIGF